MELAVIILAAGQGTRMKSPLPKVLHKVAGRSLIGHLLDRALTLNPTQVTVVVQQGSDAIREEVRRICPGASFAVQNEQRGTADAVKSAIPRLSHSTGLVLVLYADHPFISSETLQTLVKAVSSGEASMAVLGFEPYDPARYGRLLMQGDKLLAIREFKDANEQERAVRLCNSGVMAFESSHLREVLGRIENNNASKEYYLTDAVELTNRDHKICAVVKAREEEVMGVNTQGERAHAEAVAQRHLREKAMEAGVMLVAPETVHFSHDTRLAAGVVVHPFVVFGEGVVVEENVEIKSFCHFEKAVIKKNAVVGPYARLRPDAVIEENAHIGNFVEVKKATIEKGAKVNHLSYIGDARVGAGANIGAGTITCNYDGKNKYLTDIGAGAFIGSNTSLVAPVKIGENALIGAGSTVTKDVAPNVLMRNDMKELHLKKKE